MLPVMRKSYTYPADWVDSFVPMFCERLQVVYCFWSKDVSKTLAFTAMEGFSMSALLWTILSSSWAGLGFFPGPAISLAQVMVLLMTWCITETVFSHAVFRSLGWWWVQASSMAANRSPVPTNTASTLGMSRQIFWLVVVPSGFPEGNTSLSQSTEWF